jgi:hypothetical protein
LKASNADAGDWFGEAVGISGDSIIIGAYAEKSTATGVNGDQTINVPGGGGAAYVFIRNGAVWTQEAYLKASNTGTGDFFGDSVSISGDTVVVGAYSEDSDGIGVGAVGSLPEDQHFNSGAAYVFVRNTGVWSQQAYLKASNTGRADWLGRAISVDGELVVVGSTQEDSNATGINGNQSDESADSAGAAYIFAGAGPVRTGSPLVLSNPQWINPAGFQFTLIASGGPFQAVTSTNATLPIADWDVLGNLTENPPGVFTFQGANQIGPTRFYRARGP